MHFIGIDPGARGSLCILDTSTRHPVFVSLSPNIMAFEIIDAIWQEIGNPPKVHVCLEEVHSLYGMSAKSNFTFGGMFWRIRTILEAMQFPFELVQPKAWQQAVGIPAKKDRPTDRPLKQLVADHAQALYPTAVLHGPRGGLMDGRSDALMIAHYGLITHGEDYGVQTNYAGPKTSLQTE
jgi:hypothetical protein